MACNLPPVTNTTPTDHLRRSISNKDRYQRARMQRSYSDNHLFCYSIDRINSSMVGRKLNNSRSVGFSNIKIPTVVIPENIKALLFETETSKEMKVEDNFEESDNENEIEIGEGKKPTNWIERVMELRRNWKRKQDKDEVYVDGDDVACGEEEGCGVEYKDGSEERVDEEMFSSLLRRVSWSETKLFSQLAFLSNMAYVIQDIKTEDLKRYYGLDFLTSSLEKKAEAEAIKHRIEQDSIRVPTEVTVTLPNTKLSTNSEQKRQTAAYDIAASAASYVQSRSKDLISIGAEPQIMEDGAFLDNENEHRIIRRIYDPEMAVSVATSTMTAVVAAGEEEREQAAKDLQSLHSSPCEWFVCDDPSIYTRYFIVQGSDSLASWQANLFFEPTKFEDTDVLVHRGIYEAAKGIYDQFMPEIEHHLNIFGDRAKLQFAGHSLGGSLALLVNLMLLTRKKVNLSALLPVVTFGSPHVFCNGQKILDRLGLDEGHVHCVMMHRDIVPRAFSCNYPTYVAQVLKRLNRTFRSHPCLNKNVSVLALCLLAILERLTRNFKFHPCFIKCKLLYTPMGKVFILQPDEKTSPRHQLLPPGSALYTLDNANASLIKRAIHVFLNSPHPLETLSDPTAYGSEGTILRDHDSSNYLKAVNGIIRQHTRLVVRKARKERNQLWPLLTSRSPHAWSHTCNTKDGVEASKKVLTSV